MTKRIQARLRVFFLSGEVCLALHVLARPTATLTIAFEHATSFGSNLPRCHDICLGLGNLVLQLAIPPGSAIKRFESKLLSSPALFDRPRGRCRIVRMRFD